jgi:hypothetical protein
MIPFRMCRHLSGESLEGMAVTTGTSHSRDEPQGISDPGISMHSLASKSVSVAPQSVLASSVPDGRKHPCHTAVRSPMLRSTLV